MAMPIVRYRDGNKPAWGRLTAEAPRSLQLRMRDLRFGTELGGQLTLIAAQAAKHFES